MEVVVGNPRQEKNIEEMGVLANQMFPHIKTMVFKGCFRRGVRSALEKHQFQSWQEVGAQPPNVKKKFLQSVLNECLPDFERMGMKANELDALAAMLNKKHDRFLKLHG